MVISVRSLNIKSISVLVTIASIITITTGDQQVLAGQMAHDIGYQDGRSDRINNEPYDDDYDPK
jgi:hypothetical protein